MGSAEKLAEQLKIGDKAKKCLYEGVIMPTHCTELIANCTELIANCTELIWLIENGSSGLLDAALAAASSNSLPSIHMCDGIQHMCIVFPLRYL